MIIKEEISLPFTTLPIWVSLLPFNIKLQPQLNAKVVFFAVEAIRVPERLRRFTEDNRCLLFVRTVIDMVNRQVHIRNSNKNCISSPSYLSSCLLRTLTLSCRVVCCLVIRMMQKKKQKIIKSLFSTSAESEEGAAWKPELKLGIIWFTEF
jgi:hypothetical protein